MQKGEDRSVQPMSYPFRCRFDRWFLHSQVYLVRAILVLEIFWHKFQPIITQSYKLPDYSTVFQAEVEAINKGASLALEITDKTNNNLNKYGDLSKHTFHFISDSKASLQAIHKRTTDSKTVLNCINSLKLLQTHNPITLNWIKAHNNHPGNELADFLATKGTKITPPPPGFPHNSHPNNIYTPYPKPYIRNIIKKSHRQKMESQMAKIH